MYVKFLSYGLNYPGKNTLSSNFGVVGNSLLNSFDSVNVVNVVINYAV